MEIYFLKFVKFSEKKIPEVNLPYALHWQRHWNQHDVSTLEYF